MRYKILTYIVASFFFTACGNYYTKNGELIDKVSARKIKDYLIENILKFMVYLFINYFMLPKMRKIKILIQVLL